MNVHGLKSQVQEWDKPFWQRTIMAALVDIQFQTQAHTLLILQEGDIQLKILVQAQQTLLNVYSAIIDDPRNAALTNTNFDASLLFVNYLGFQ